MRSKKLRRTCGGSPRQACAGHTRRGLVSGRDAGRPEEQAHLPLGQEGLTSPSRSRSAHPINLSVRCGLPGTRNRRCPGSAVLQHQSHAASSGRNRHKGQRRRPRDPPPRSDRLARIEGPRDTQKHIPLAAAAAGARAQQPRKYLAVHATELAVEPNLQILRRRRRSLLLCMEHAHQSALENHVYRPPRLGSHRSLNLRIGIRRSYSSFILSVSSIIISTRPYVSSRPCAQSLSLCTASSTCVTAYWPGFVAM